MSRLYSELVDLAKVAALAAVAALVATRAPGWINRIFGATP